MGKLKKNQMPVETIRMAEYLSDEPFPLFVRFFDVGKPVVRHRHEFMELVIVSRGRGIHFTDLEEYSIEAGDVFAITGDTAHGYRDVDELQVVNVLFDPAWFSVLSGPARKSMGFHALFSLEPRFRKMYRLENKLHLRNEELREVLELVNRLMGEFETKKPLYEMMVQTIFLQIVGLLSRFYDRREIPVGDSLLMVGKCLSLMENGYMRQIQLSALAKAVHLSPRSLLRTFKQVMGISPIDYLIRLRVEKARELLRDPRMSITEIALRVGFSDSNYFSRQFRKITGGSPRRLKARLEDTPSKLGG
jgi:AraC-like DNA-binding protein